MSKHTFILAINPGSTSTKVALYDAEQSVATESISHSAQELAPFTRIMEQKAFRTAIVLSFLDKNNLKPSDLSAVVGRGGLLTPMPSGTYQVTEPMLAYLETAPLEHASNLGAPIAAALAAEGGIPAFIVDPVVVDEMEPVARLSGLKELERISIFHALNQKAAARMAARELGKPYHETHQIVAHLGGGISVGAHRKGRVIDVNNALNGDGPYSPERAGTLPAWPLVELSLGLPQPASVKRMITGQGGVVSLLGTNDMREVESRAASGDEEAALVLDGMAYNVAKSIGALGAVLEGQIDAIVLTGGIAHSKVLVEAIRKRVSFMGKILVFPGEDEMQALSQGALRVLREEEPPLSWNR